MKRILIILLALAFAAVFCACSGSDSSSSGEPASASEPASSMTPDEPSEFSEPDSSAPESSDTESAPSESSEESSEESSGESSEESSEESSRSGTFPSIPTDDPAFLEKWSENSIDDEYQYVLDTSGSMRSWMQACAVYEGRWKEEIDNAYKILLGVSDSPEAVKSAQEAWLIECAQKTDELNNSYDETTDGSLQRFSIANEILLLYRSRAADLYAQVYVYDPDFRFVYTKE